jgi:hypothetical protein
MENNNKDNALLEKHFWLQKSRILILIVFCFLFALGFTIDGYKLLKAVYIVVCALAIGGILAYIFTGNDSRKADGSFLSKYKFELFLLLGIFCVYLPLLFQNYLFYDDYWLFRGDADQITVGLSTSRALNGVLFELFDFVDSSDTCIVRGFAVIMLALFGLMLQKWLQEKSGKPFLSFIITLSVCAGSAVIDSVGYGATFPFTMGLAFSAFAVVAFYEAVSRFKRKSYFYCALALLISLCSLLIGFSAHQLATSVVFLMIAVVFWFRPDEKYRYLHFLLFMVLLAVSVGVYMVLNNFFIAHYSVSIINRTALADLAHDFPAKLAFFTNTVLPQSMDYVIASILGGRLFLNPGRLNTYMNPYLPQTVHTLQIIIGCIICLGIIWYAVKTKKIANTVLLVLFIPFSFYSLFVLKETSFVSYYSVGIFAYILFLLIMGVASVFEISTKRRREKQNSARKGLAVGIVLFVLTFAICLNGFGYISEFWVAYNSNGYNYIKNTIQVNESQNRRIHIYGVIFPGQGNVYSKFAALTALDELGMNAGEYEISTSDNEWYVSIIEDKDFEMMKEKWTKEETEWMQQAYSHSTVYARWSISLTNPDMDTLLKLQSILQKGGMIPKEGEDILEIDLGWVTRYWAK